MDFQEKLQERMGFYQQAYKDTSNELIKAETRESEARTLLRTNAANLMAEAVKKEMSQEYIYELEKSYNIELNDIMEKYSRIENTWTDEISGMKNDSRYKEYLHFMISDDLKMVINMEKDEVFDYLIAQDFHNENFKNEPYFNVFGFVFQPRFWKFAEIADKKARELGLEDHKEMFKLWSDLRVKYKSLAGDKRIVEVIDECERLEVEIKTLEEKIENIPELCRKDIISRLVDILETCSSEYLSQVGVPDLRLMKERLDAARGTVESLRVRMNRIMENISGVEKMMEVYETKALQQNEQAFERFFGNNDPAVPIYELIPIEAWDEIKEAFEKKGIKLKSRDNYTVVKRKISSTEKEKLLKKYGVQEGEIFFDETLSGK